MINKQRFWVAREGIKMGSSLPPGIILLLIAIGMAIAPSQMDFQPPTIYAWGAVSAFTLGVFLVCISVKHIISIIVGLIALIVFGICAWQIFGPLF